MIIKLDVGQGYVAITGNPCLGTLALRRSMLAASTLPVDLVSWMSAVLPPSESI